MMGVFARDEDWWRGYAISLENANNNLREEIAEAHDTLVMLAADLCWATDGKLRTAVRHAEGILRKRTQERDDLAAENERLRQARADLIASERALASRLADIQAILDS